MLVLARRAGESIVFPDLGVTLEVVRIQGSVARLGIQAPPEIKVLRQELANRAPPAADKLPHALRNRLHAATLAVHLLQRQLESGMTADAEATLEKVSRQFQALEQELAGHRAPAQASSPKAPCRALLVEDDDNERELLAGYLRLSGFDVVTAIDGCEALDYLATQRKTDIVLLDMLMPRCDGPTTVREIRCNTQYEGLKIFAVSGTAPADLGVRSGPAGVDRWFPKPLNPNNLVREIHRELAASCGPM